MRLRSEGANGGSAWGSATDHLVSCRRYELNGVTVVVVAGEVDLDSAPTFRDELFTAIAGQSPRLVVDLADVTFLDYSGLGVLVGALRRARADGGWIHLARPTRAVRQALGITHLDRIFPIHDTLDDATAHAAAGHAAPYGRSELPL